MKTNKTIKVYHGTTKESYRSILNNLYKKDEFNSIWSCSDKDGYFYLWNSDKCLEDYEENEVHEVLLKSSFESAQLQAAFRGKDTKLIVLELEIPSELIEDDDSCENMDWCSRIDFNNFNPEFIKRVYSCDFNSWLSPFVLTNISNNNLFNKFYLDEKMEQFMEKIKNYNIFLDDIYGLDYHEGLEEC